MRSKHKSKSIKPFLLLGTVLTIIGLMFFRDNSYGCNRKYRLDNLPQYDRALSLINQRVIEYDNDANILKNKKLITPCIAIIQSNTKITDKAEGYFIFGGKNVRNNYYPIYVDESYSNTDDLLNALLIYHEITHVIQFIDEQNDVRELSCIDKEIEAFKAQIEFLHTLNTEEITTLDARILSNGKHPQLQFLREYALAGGVAVNKCGDNNKCFNNYLDTFIENKVEELYKDHCNL